MRLFQVLKAGENRMIGDFCDVTDGIHTSIDYDEESCVNLISATSPRENYFDLSRNAKISEHIRIIQGRRCGYTMLFCQLLVR